MLRYSRTPLARRAAIAALCLAIVLNACTIREDAAPRDIPVEQRGQFGAQPTGDVAAGSNHIFLVTGSGDEQPKLRSVLREAVDDPEAANDAEAILASLLLGANALEQDRGLSSFLPEELQVESARVRARTLTIDVNDAFNELTPEALRFAVAQLVTTGSEIEGVQQVRIRIDEANQVWPLGDGENTDRALTVYDYPGFVESSQPAYPATPTANP